jgi:hypothetical protein
MPDIQNPIGAILGGVGNALGDAATSGLNAAMLGIWNFAVTLLSGVFEWIDKLGAPNVDPRTGPLAGVLPTTLWLGAFVLVLLAFVQIGRAALDGGKGFATLLVGIAQYVVIATGGLGFLAVLVSATDALSVGLLQGGLHVNNWQGISGQNSVLTNAVHTVGGVGLGLIGLFVLLPTALGLVVETLVRHASILVLAATIPLLAAGLVQETTTRWFWTGLRWMVALLLLSPAVALVMVIGLRSAAGATGADGASQSAGMATVQLVVSSAVMLISLLCPLALFKLLAFMEPTTISGARMRGFFAGAERGGDSPGAASSTQDSANGADTDTANRFAGAARNFASSAASTAGGMLDTVGAGHGGSPQNEPSSRSRSKTRSQGGETAPNEAGTAPAAVEPAPPTGGGAPGTPSTPSPSPSGSPASGSGAAGAAGGTGGGAAGGSAAGAAGAAGALEGVEAAAVVVAL